MEGCSLGPLQSGATVGFLIIINDFYPGKINYTQKLSLAKKREFFFIQIMRGRDARVMLCRVCKLLTANGLCLNMVSKLLMMVHQAWSGDL